MFLAMNRFKVKRGREAEFIAIWQQRNSYLDEVPGFVSFNLLQAESEPEYSLFASHSVWESEQAFENWTKSEAFRKAHANAGGSPRDLYIGPPHLEMFRSVL